MKNLPAATAAVAVISLLTVSGCATVASGSHAEVKIHSNPENAHVTVRNQQGETVAEATTPAVVALKRGAGPFRRARYTATIEKPGYQTAQAPIGSSLNPWVFGNVVLGGIPGVVVDPVTGAAWKPNPGEIHQNLIPAGYSELAGSQPAVQAGQQPAVVATAAIDPADPNRIR
jgi:hypothetical protein